jgi:hypothetical protein
MPVATSADLDSLKLTVDDGGQVWYLEGDDMPASSGQPVDAFLPTIAWDRVRLVGMPANAELAVRLYEQKRAGRLQSLEVCSPFCCESVEDRKDPEVLLFKMRAYEAPVSVGGWHQFAERDVLSYLLAAHVYAGKPIGATQYKILMAHQVWPALSFIRRLDTEAVCKLIGTIIDPRWYVDAVDPDSPVRLEQFLGLYQKIQTSKIEPSDSSKRYQLVLDCWKTSAPGGQLQKLGPDQFLWRTWHAKGGGTKGDLGASKLFVEYLKAVWTVVVCDGPKTSRLFVPEHFFASEDEVKAYKAHAEKKCQPK